ncbi:Hypothetical predicted protein [Olea europaea subsp. europaea]|uniref:DUF668 domain-containing protein n=1 Tax=Olea europaea subsp. europaea TaxID=158383 RepID=A0A8S0P9C4_OLEEU|nr:Hypothetical predicted protein [Olea europaea subsp. europaea]
MVAESWFRSLWRTSKNHGFDSRNARIGVLAFEAASLMSKLLHLWQLLTDKQVAKLREEITNSVGTRKLVSEDDDRIVRLICIEIMENLGKVARAVGRLSKQCSDPLLRSFEQAYNDLIKIGADTYGWQFTWNKMDKKAKKMERLITKNANLYQEMDTLADLEQTLTRMKGNDDTDGITFVEYEKKFAWKKLEVKHLKENSLWNRSYDYTIHLLARSVFTIYGRLGHVFGINHMAFVGVTDSGVSDSNYSRHSQSILFTRSSVHPSENSIPRHSSGSLGNTISMSGPISRANNVSYFHSGPLGNSITASGPISGKRGAGSFYSGPLVRSTEKSASLPKATKSSRFWQFRDKSSNSKQKIPYLKPNRLTASGPLTECMMSGVDVKVPDVTKDVSTELQSHGNSTQKQLLNALPESLGAAALALHYANIIVVIEKLVASPYLIGNEARSDLYNMLPASIRAGLRVRLKPCTKSLSLSFYDTARAGDWNQSMSDILDWLAPLAHNMIKWQSERGFEHQNLAARTNVLLVQTLYFANQEKTEESIIELLVGLNYVWRFGREVNANLLVDDPTG